MSAVGIKMTVLVIGSDCMLRNVSNTAFKYALGKAKKGARRSRAARCSTRPTSDSGSFDVNRPVYNGVCLRLAYSPHRPGLLRCTSF